MANDLIFQPPGGATIHGTLSSWEVAEPREATIYEQTATMNGWPLCGVTLRVRSINLYETVEMAGLVMRAITLTMTDDRNLMPEREAAWTEFSRTYAEYMTEALHLPAMCAAELDGLLLIPTNTYKDFQRTLDLAVLGAVQRAHRQTANQLTLNERHPDQGDAAPSATVNPAPTGFLEAHVAARKEHRSRRIGERMKALRQELGEVVE